jgi:hypothetical protein
MRIKKIALAAILAMATAGLSGCYDHPGYASDHHRGDHHRGDHHRGDSDHYRN